VLAVCMTLIDDDDKSKFRKIYDSLERKLFVFSMSRLHNNALAEEAVSETFLALAKNFKKIHSLEPAEIVAYTVIINRNVCIDILEKENKHSINVQIDDKIKEISEDYDHIEKLIVADMVEKLPDIYRDVIMMKYFYGFKVKEISKQLHLSVGGVKSRLEKARKILRKDINDDE
jgi:RNA polymerase sigma-70 factor (ECF subfamily)